MEEVKHDNQDVNEEKKVHEEHKEHEHPKKHHKHHGPHDEHCKCHDHQECKCHEHPEPPHEKRIKELEDELLRSKAEFINYRKRLEDEQVRLLKFCNEDLIKETLPILDNFERAISMDDTNLDDEVSKFLSGFKMIYCNFVNVLKNYGVIEIGRNRRARDRRRLPRPF